MSKLLRPLILPTFLFLFLSAQECSEDTVSEEVTVLPDGGMEIAYQHTAKILSRILDSDPTPSAKKGWDSVFVGKARENREEVFYLQAWNEIPAGARLPSSYASPDDPLSDWYVRFPSTLEREEQGDTVLFRYSRTYEALPWTPMGHLNDLERELDTLQEAMDAFEESGMESFEKRWKDSGALRKAEEEADTTALRQYQADFRDLVMRGTPPPVDLAQAYFTIWAKASLWEVLGFSIPVAEQFCGESNVEPMRLVFDVMEEVLERRGVSEEFALAAILEEEGIEPDSTVFPELVSMDFDLWDDSWIEAQRAEAVQAVRDSVLGTCQLSGPDLIEFDRRVAWLNDRFRISDMKVRDQRFLLHLILPGELVETNADTVVDGRAQWDFRVGDLFDGDVVVRASSRLVTEAGPHGKR